MPSGLNNLNISLRDTADEWTGLLYRTLYCSYVATYTVYGLYVV